MFRSAIKGALLGVGLLYPLGALMALTVGFPMVFAGSRGDSDKWAAFYTGDIPWGRGFFPALFSPLYVTFYGVFFGIFPLAAIVGAVVGVVRAKPRRPGQDPTNQPEGK